MRVCGIWTKTTLSSSSSQWEGFLPRRSKTSALSHPIPSCLLLRLSPGGMQSVNKGALPLSPTQGMETVRWAWLAESTGVPQFMRSWLPAQAAASHLYLSTQLLEHRGHSERNLPLSPFNCKTLAQKPPGEKQAINRQHSISSQGNWLHCNRPWRSASQRTLQD